MTEKESLAPVLTCRTGGSTEAADPSNMQTSCLVQSQEGRWSLSGAGQGAGWRWASAAGARRRTGPWRELCDADARRYTGNTATCCRACTGSARASALDTLSSSGGKKKKPPTLLCVCVKKKKQTVNTHSRKQEQKG